MDCNKASNRKRAIGCKWLCKTKYKIGTSERHKARLVIQECGKQKGIGYEETFVFVTKMANVRSVLTVVGMKSWNVCQMDVTNAFLHGDLEEDVYVKLPKGYRGYGKQILCQSNLRASIATLASPLIVCKLHKSLYA